MRLFGEQFVKNYGFTAITKDNIEEALKSKDPILFFGIYDVNDINFVVKCKKRLHIHWAGTDAWWYWKYHRDKGIEKPRHHQHSCENVYQKNILSASGIPAFIRPLFSGDMDDYRISPLLEDFKVMIYYRAESVADYHPKLMMEVAQKCPDMTFHLVGDKKGEVKNIPQNVINHGYVTQERMVELLADSHCLLRITGTDALSNMLIQAVLMGRQVVTNYDLPFVKTTRPKVKSIIRALKKIRQENKLNKSGEWFYRKGGWINNWDFLTDEIYKNPLVSIIIVKSREKWFRKALDSCGNQYYQEREIVLIGNMDKKMSIGKAYNEGVRQAKGKYVYFLGDDDRISQDMLLTSVMGIEEMQRAHPHGVGLSTHVSLLNEEGNIIGFSPWAPTGLWLRNFLLKYPFNEKMRRYVDTEMMDRTEKLGFGHGILPHHFGYFYRTHKGQVSGKKTPSFKLKNQIKLGV